MKNRKLIITIAFVFLEIANSFSINSEKQNINMFNNNLDEGISLVAITLPTTTNGNVAKFTYSPESYNNVDYYVDTSRCFVVTSTGDLEGASLTGEYLYLVFKNIKKNKTSHNIQCIGIRNFQPSTGYLTINGFTLEMHQPTFEAGTTLNVPCYKTTVEIKLDSYVNSEGLDEGLVITDEFEWTLPTGWSTTDSQSGTFVAGPTINLIVPSSTSDKSISVKAKAGNQYSSTATLDVTRNIGDFTISGNSNVNCGQSYQYSTENFSGVLYSWQLPDGWTGSSSSNTINTTVNGTFGNIIVTATACNSQVSKDTLSIQNVKIIPDNATFNGPEIFCSSGSTYSITNLFSNSTVSWNNKSSNIGLSSSTATTAYLYGIGSGDGTIQPRITMSCGYDDMQTENIWIGYPDSDDFEVYIEDLSGNPVQGNELCVGEQYHISLYPYFLFDDYGITDVEFDFTFDYDILDEGDDYIEIEVNFSPEDEEGEVYVTNDCGYYTLKWMSFQEGLCGYYLMMTPNPTVSETSISIESNLEYNKFDENVDWEIEIYDQSHSLKIKEQKIKGKSKKISTNGWKDGIYNVRAKYKKFILTDKLVVQSSK